MSSSRENYRVVQWDDTKADEFDFTRAFVVPRGMHLADGGFRFAQTRRAPRITAPREGKLYLETLVSLVGKERIGKEKRILRRTHRVGVRGLERILYEDVRAGRFYLEIAAPKIDRVGENGIVRKYLDTDISVRCPKCGLSDWVLLRHTVRTVFDGRKEVSCYRITLVCKHCDRYLSGLGVALASAWERCERSAAGAFRRIRGIKLRGDAGEIEATVTIDQADVRLRRC